MWKRKARLHNRLTLCERLRISYAVIMNPGGLGIVNQTQDGSKADGAPSSVIPESEATRGYRPGMLGDTDKLYAARHIVEQIGGPGWAYAIEVQAACEFHSICREMRAACGGKDMYAVRIDYSDGAKE